MRTLLLLATAALALACGGGDDTTDDARGSCRALCDKQGMATGCTDVSTYVAQCKTLCDVVVPALDADCRAKAKTAFDCQAALSYMCFEGGNVPFQTTDDCAAELEAYSTCLGNQ